MKRNCQYICAQEGISDYEVECMDVGILRIESDMEIYVDYHSIYSVNGNFLLFKNKEEKIQLKARNGSLKFELLSMKREFLDDFVTSSMTDCPIFYDFIRLETNKLEYLF